MKAVWRVRRGGDGDRGGGGRERRQLCGRENILEKWEEIEETEERDGRVERKREQWIKEKLVEDVIFLMRFIAVPQNSNYSSPLEGSLTSLLITLPLPSTCLAPRTHTHAQTDTCTHARTHTYNLSSLFTNLSLLSTLQLNHNHGFPFYQHVHHTTAGQNREREYMKQTGRWLEVKDEEEEEDNLITVFCN